MMLKQNHGIRAQLHGARLPSYLGPALHPARETETDRTKPTPSTPLTPSTPPKNMYSKQEWRHFVARSLPSHIPTLPKTTLGDLKQAGREEVLRMYGSRNWEFCLTCKKLGSEYVLKKCGGCGAFPGNRALYCVRPPRLSYKRFTYACDGKYKIIESEMSEGGMADA